MSYVRELTYSRSGSPASPRISLASRLSISVQLVDVPTITVSPVAARRRWRASRRV